MIVVKRGREAFQRCRRVNEEFCVRRWGQRRRRDEGENGRESSSRDQPGVRRRGKRGHRRLLREGCLIDRRGGRRHRLPQVQRPFQCSSHLHPHIQNSVVQISLYEVARIPPPSSLWPPARVHATSLREICKPSHGLMVMMYYGERSTSSLAMKWACIASRCAVCSCISLAAAVMEASEEDDEGNGLIAVAAAAAADWSSHEMSSLAAAVEELWVKHRFHQGFKKKSLQRGCPMHKKNFRSRMLD